MAYIKEYSTITIGQTCRFIIECNQCTHWNIRWKMGTQEDDIAVMSTDTVIDYVFPADLYKEMPNRTEGRIWIHVYGYVGGVLKHQSSNDCPIYINESMCRPTISIPTVREASDAAFALTGDRDKLIRHVSAVDVGITASGKNYATVNPADIVLTNNNRAYYGTQHRVDTFSSEHFYIKATDSRGLVTSIKYTLPSERIVEYIKLTCNMGNERQDAHGNMRLTCSGNYFNSSFGAVNNTLTVEYRYKETGGEFGAWATMSATTNGNTYSASADLTGLDYKKTYVFECRATDKAMTISSAETMAQALPVFHWSKDDFVHETPVDFRAGITFNGKKRDYIVEQGTDGAWEYRLWDSGRAECWASFTKSVSGSDWTAWGSLYMAEIISGEDLPSAVSFIDVPREYATLHSMSGGLLNCFALSRSNITTGTYYAVHPNKLSSTYSHILELYAVGYWK